jgi:hypothetical protein
MHPSSGLATTSSSTAPGGLSAATRGVVVAAAVLLATVFAGYGPIPQPASYHAFADARTLLGVPYFMDVVSNLLFVLAGVWGMATVARKAHPQGARVRAAWFVAFAAILCTGLGSAYYHWAPDNWGLLIDRIPIAWACGVLLCTFLAEREHSRWAHPAALALGVVASTLAAVHWYLSTLSGPEDLRLYLYVQLLPMLLIPLALMMSAITRRAPLAGQAVAGRDWFIVVGCYALAKLFEVTDHAVFDALGLVSGHTLKHVWAAAAAAWLVVAYRRLQVAHI